MNDKQMQKLARLCQDAGLAPYRNHSSYAKSDAQRNLNERTHYVDEGTLKAFSCNILSSHVLYHGLLYGIVESVKAPRGRIYRGVVFDIDGHVIYRPDVEASFNRSAPATKAFWAAVNEMDAVQITLDRVLLLQSRHQKQVRELGGILEEMKL